MTRSHGTRIIGWTIALAAVGILGGVAVYAGASWLNSSPKNVELYSLEIEPGMSAGRVAEKLEREGLIRSARFFRVLARFRGFDRQIHAGTHWVDGRKTTSGILAQLLSGGIRIVRITVPEGLVIDDIAELLAKALPFEPEEFVEACQDSELVATLAYPGAKTMEGYLFPDTYFFDVNAGVRETIGVMSRRFHNVFADSLVLRADSLRMSVHEIVTLASIIEKEAQVRSEQPIISQVFHKRLKIGYRLGADPTVKYAMGQANRRLSLRDIEVDSPYNTYKHRGLPPGPICSPGRGALHAALYPADTNYLYFVANWDGTHTFTKTLLDHNRAKKVSNQRYWEWRREQRRREAEQGG